MLYIPKGYVFSTAEANFRYRGRDDLAIIVSKKVANCAAVFTRNLFKAAPILVCMDKLKASNVAQAIVINSGIANAGTGDMGFKNCLKSIELTGKYLEINPELIFPSSTGVIGEQFDMECWERGVEQLRQNLGKKDVVDVAKAIMTTDTFPKIASLQTGDISITGIAKGAGMICPDMATMLAFIISDVEIEPQLFQKILKRAVENTFNRISVDGDTSTNDCVIALANGANGKKIFTKKDISLFEGMMFEVCEHLAYKIVQDAEGGTKIIHLKVTGTKTIEDAEKIAKSIANSPLVKTAFYGEDANWGRIVAAIGRSGAHIDIYKMKIKIQDIEIFKNGTGIDMDIDSLTLPYLKKQDIYLEVNAGEQTEIEYNMLFSDLSEEYVKINGSYRS